MLTGFLVEITKLKILIKNMLKYAINNVNPL